jgi:hypothetical protein
MTDVRSTAVSDSPVCWPALPLSAWQDTRDTLHMWTQIVGKVRLALTPKINHWWNAALYVTARSKLPQKKWTGLDLPIKRERKTLSTSSTETSVRQKRRAYSLS